MAICIILAYFRRTDPFVLTVSTTLAATIVAILTREAVFLHGRLTWPLLLARTRYWGIDVRISFAYLIRIEVDDEFLLIRGRRVETQFQPVGGVYKTDLTQPELMRRFGARPDDRFTPDLASRADLRLRLPGRNLPYFVRWFESGVEREFTPNREFYEELVGTGLVPRQHFDYVDFSYLARRTFGMEFDNYSDSRQLIVCDIFSIRLTEDQAAELAGLKVALGKGPPTDLYFASAVEVQRGGVVSGASAPFEIARTSRWLLDR